MSYDLISNVVFTKTWYNEPLDERLLQCIKKYRNVSFGEYFNQKLDDLPNNLIGICFGLNSTFNKPLDYLPETVAYIGLGRDFNHSLANLPHNLKRLEFSIYSEFDKSLDLLPNSVEEIKLSDNYNTKINKFPSNLKVLKLGKKYNHELDNLPEGMEELHLYDDTDFDGVFGRFGSENYFSRGKKYNFTKDLLNLPSSLKIIMIGKGYEKEINVPNGCKLLNFTRNIANV